MLIIIQSTRPENNPKKAARRTHSDGTSICGYYKKHHYPSKLMVFSSCPHLKQNPVAYAILESVKRGGLKWRWLGNISRRPHMAGRPMEPQNHFSMPKTNRQFVPTFRNFYHSKTLRKRSEMLWNRQETLRNVRKCLETSKNVRKLSETIRKLPENVRKRPINIH